jgi:hypothetical protein
MLKQIACLFVLVTVAGCGGASGTKSALQPPVTLPAPNGTQRTINGYPVFDPGAVSRPADIAHVSPTQLRPASGAVVDLLRSELRQMRAIGRRPSASFGGSVNDGHGQDGFFISATFDANHAGMEFVHTVWVPNTDVTLNQPPASNYNGYFLYAPTTHPVQSCIEVGTAYHTSPPPYATGTDSYVYFFDFCNNGATGNVYTNDSTFRGTYNFWDSNINAPAIDVLVTTAGTSLSAPDWYAYVWNTTTYSWNLLYSRTYATRQSGLTPPTSGWSIFEPNFQDQPTAQACKQYHTPQFAADYIRFVNPSNGTTTYVDSSNSTRTTAGACVTADSTGAASYNFLVDQANWRWEAYANGN